MAGTKINPHCAFFSSSTLSRIHSFFFVAGHVKGCSLLSLLLSLFFIHTPFQCLHIRSSSVPCSPSSPRFYPSSNMRPELRQAVTKLFKYLLITYAILSVIYTASYLVATYSGTSHDFGGLLPKARDAHAESDQQESLSTHSNEQQHQQQEQQQQLGDHSVAWSNAHGAVQVLPENLIMSKVFSEAMGPSNMTPYFFRAKETFDKEDITMSTLVTRNRFLVLSRLASNYKGNGMTIA